MFTLTFSYVFILFITYSIIGWMCEVIYCGILAKKFINRGFLHGPWCPVYGFGALCIIGLLTPFKRHIYILYPAAFVITGLVEYATGWLLETLFNTKWWDYSKRNFNIKGRVCLGNLLLFALGGTLAVMFVHPFFLRILDGIPVRTQQYAAFGILIFFIVDLAATLKKLVNFTEYVAALQDFAESLKERYENEPWFASQSISEMFAAVKHRAQLKQGEISERLLNKIDSLSERKAAVERFIKKFPSLQNAAHPFSIQHIKEQLKKRLK